MKKGDDGKHPTTVRLQAAVKGAVQEVAEELGISLNAALSVLLSEALTARGRHPGSRRR